MVILLVIEIPDMWSHACKFVSREMREWKKTHWEKLRKNIPSLSETQNFKFKLPIK